MKAEMTFSVALLESPACVSSASSAPVNAPATGKVESFWLMGSYSHVQFLRVFGHKLLSVLGHQKTADGLRRYLRIVDMHPHLRRRRAHRIDRGIDIRIGDCIRE